MIKIEKAEIVGWDHVIRGMRNPKNSWDRSDSRFNIYCDDIQCDDCPTKYKEDCVDELLLCNGVDIGPNDHKLMCDLAAGGPVHAKYRRMIVVYVDITAPLYWWKEFDTYKVGTVANSCSTMHKIHDKEFTLEDFSCEHLVTASLACLNATIEQLNWCRESFLKTKDKGCWWQMIQLLPSSYNQKRTVMLNYEVLVGIYKWRKNHKLDEWREFCEWIEKLPYAELIIGEAEKKEEE